MKRACLAIAMLAACGTDTPMSGDDGPGSDDDPLTITDTPPAGSLDDLHQRIIAKRCSGQPGLCHNGQFEPNLSTPALTYAYLVNRPGLEKPNELRAKPMDSAHSLVIDKLRNRNGVATQMPLGAEPLEEADIKALEAWIDAGALRAPGAAPAPILDNPPRRPEIAIYSGTTRLDTGGPVKINAGTTLTLRHSVQDFETADDAIPFAAVVLTTGGNKDVVLNPAATNDPQIGQTTYDASGPMSKGDKLDYKRDVTIGATVTMYDTATKMRHDVSSHGMSFTVIALYIDSGMPAMAAFDFGAMPIQVQ